MCGRYVIVSKVKVIEKRFKLPPLLVDHDLFSQHLPNFNLAPGNLGPVITNDKPNELQLFRFGYSNPKKPKPPFVINARSEGSKNKDNDINYKGGPGIVTSYFWKDAINQRRCVVFADAFYEGPQKEKLKKPNLCYLLNKERPFAFAGIWCYIPHAHTGEAMGTFAILTHVANDLMQKIKHHRSPVILEPHEIYTWLDTNAPLQEATKLLKPYPGYKMNAYPVDPIKIKLGKSKRNDKDLLEPIGQRVYPEAEDVTTAELKLFGMGRRRKKDQKDIEASQNRKEELNQFGRPDSPDLFDIL